MASRRSSARCGRAGARECKRQKNALGRTTANCDGGIFLTRYVWAKSMRSSTTLAAGNSAGNFGWQLTNSLKQLKKALELESSPGHHFQ